MLLISSILFLCFLWVCYRKDTSRSAVFSALRITNTKSKKLIGFFHPYCNAGGGGERVLWTAIAAIQRTEPNIISVIYTGDIHTSKQAIIHNVQTRFNITLHPSTLHFVFLKSRHLLEDSLWPRFTLLGQSLASIYLAWEALSSVSPDLFIDTMGYAFTFNLVSLFYNIPIGAYIHYPTISKTMLNRVSTRQTGHTNTQVVSQSPILTSAKLLYYRIFMYYYAASIRRASFIMVNSSWTKSHIDEILQHSDPLLDAIHILPYLSPVHKINTPKIVYPPCDTKQLTTFQIRVRERVILSIAQFRPEKDHASQLGAFQKLLSQHPEHRQQDVRLVLLGGCRNIADETRVEELRQLAKKLQIDKQVEFLVNATYPDMLSKLSTASIGLSTMVDEHFGIGIVEFMAAGLIPVTHASGGPMNDIVVPFNGEPTGYHAQDTDSFADALHQALTLSAEEQLALRHRARTWATQQFSEEQFEKGWNACGWREYVCT